MDLADIALLLLFTVQHPLLTRAALERLLSPGRVGGLGRYASRYEYNRAQSFEGSYLRNFIVSVC